MLSSTRRKGARLVPEGKGMSNQGVRRCRRCEDAKRKSRPWKRPRLRLIRHLAFRAGDRIRTDDVQLGNRVRLSARMTRNRLKNRLSTHDRMAISAPLQGISLECEKSPCFTVAGRFGGRETGGVFP